MSSSVANTNYLGSSLTLRPIGLGGSGNGGSFNNDLLGPD